MASVQKWGNSLGVRIPRHIAEEIGLSDGREVSVEKYGDALIIRPVRVPQYSLKKLLKGVTPKNVHREDVWFGAGAARE